MFINDMKFYDEISDDEFVETIFSFDFTAEEIKSIEKDYTYNNKSTMKKLEESIQSAYNKKIREPRITYEWTIDDYKNASVGLV